MERAFREGAIPELVKRSFAGKAVARQAQFDSA
jgi:hypothetical protein